MSPAEGKTGRSTSRRSGSSSLQVLRHIRLNIPPSFVSSSFKSFCPLNMSMGFKWSIAPTNRGKSSPPRASSLHWQNIILAGPLQSNHQKLNGHPTKLDNQAK
jgi:hypothetical protein